MNMETKKMDLNKEFDKHLTRRQLFGLGAKGIGIAAQT